MKKKSLDEFYRFMRRYMNEFHFLEWRFIAQQFEGGNPANYGYLNRLSLKVLNKEFDSVEKMIRWADEHQLILNPMPKGEKLEEALDELFLEE